MSAAATAAGYLYARGRLSGAGFNGEMDAERSYHAASARRTLGAQERPVAG